MSTLDHEHHDLLLSVLVVGGASAAFLSGLPLRDGELRLGKVQEWTPRLRFEGFSVDPWSGDGSEGARLESLLPQVDALVLTDALAEGTHYSSAAVERLSRALGPVKLRVPAAIFGGPALAQEWTTLSGAQPVFVGEPTPENVMPAVKGVLKVLLKTLSPTGKTIPPPDVA
jgi:hypothetical protein